MPRRNYSQTLIFLFIVICLAHCGGGDGGNEEVSIRDLKAAGMMPFRLEQTTAYDLVFDDRGSGADRDLSVWRPRIQEGYVRFADVAQPNHSAPTVAAVIAQDSPEYLQPPVSFEKIWDGRGSNSFSHLSFWRPIPPEGFLCLGDVAGDPLAYEAPSTDQFRCLRKDLIAPAILSTSPWTDKGSTAVEDVRLWTISAANSSDTAVGSFIANNNYESPTGVLVWALKGRELHADEHAVVNDPSAFELPQRTSGGLEYAHVSTFSLITTDHYTGSKRDLSVWRPIVPDGYSILGDVANDSYLKPTEPVVVVKEGPFTAKPIDFVKIWDSSGSEAPVGFAFWKPIPPEGFTCLGHVASHDLNFQKPATSLIACIRDDVLSPATVGSMIWNDEFSGAITDVSIWPVVRTNAVDIVPHTFISVPNHDFPAGESSIKVIKGDQATNTGEHLMQLSVEAVVETAPILKPLTIRRVYQYDLITDDSGSGASMDGSFWRPRFYLPNYYILGDVANRGYSPPSVSTILVKDDPELLAAPLDFEPVWADHGSHAHKDTSVWRPIPPQGFTCLGDIVARNYYKPSTNIMRCVANVLVAQGAIGDMIWNDQHSGAHQNIAVWRSVKVNKEDTDANLFVSEPGYNSPWPDGFKVLSKGAVTQE